MQSLAMHNLYKTQYNCVQQPAKTVIVRTTGECGNGRYLNCEFPLMLLVGLQFIM